MKQEEVFEMEKSEIDKAVGDKEHKVFPADFKIRVLVCNFSVSFGLLLLCVYFIRYFLIYL